jgi:hypothetical protein
MLKTIEKECAVLFKVLGFRDAMSVVGGVFSLIAPCTLMAVYQHFGGIFCLFLQPYSTELN